MKPPTYETSGGHRKLTYVPPVPERSRVYLFPGGDRIEIEGVVRAQASRHGNHQLTTLDGTVHVIPWGWISLSFPVEAQATPQEVASRGEGPGPLKACVTPRWSDEPESWANRPVGIDVN